MYLRRLGLLAWNLLFVVANLMSVAFGSCTDGFLWDEVKQTCVDCLDLCQHPRAFSCLKQCREKSKLTRHRRDAERGCVASTCGYMQYCDTGVGSCSSCYVICENHEYQGTTKQCRDQCPEFFTTPSTTATPSTSVTSTAQGRRVVTEGSGVSVVTLVSVILVVLLLLTLSLIGYLVWRYKERMSPYFCCRKEEEKKTPIPCSQESEEGFIDSKTPLTGTSGPVVQERNSPQPAMEPPYDGNLGHEMGFPEVQCRYVELDRPETLLTTPKRI